LDPTVWGPHYWFFLHTVAYHYPNTPNEVTKRKYYDLIQNLPLFIPRVDMGDRFSEMLDKYPVTPYLDNRESFMRWVWFIHNKMNVHLEKDEMTLWTAVDAYMAQFLPEPVSVSETTQLRKMVTVALMASTLLVVIYVFA
jgi:hypothetical protein